MMKNMSSSAECAISAVFCAVFASSAFASTVLDRAEQSVVRVINLDQQGARLEFNGVGSGVVIDPAGFILTNAHVVVGADKVYVQWKTSANVVRDDEAEVVAIDREKDLAMLRVRNLEIPIVLIATRALPKGQAVFAIGFPAAADLSGNTYDDINQGFVEATVTQGIVSRILTRPLPSNPSWPLVQHSAVTSGGSSGGALIDGCGYLVGVSAAVAVEQTPEGDVVKVQGFSYAIQASEAFRFAKNNGANPEEIRGGCKTDADSPKPESDMRAGGELPSPTILAFVLGTLGVFSAAVAVFTRRSRARRSVVGPAPLEQPSTQWEIEGFTGSNMHVKFTVFGHRHTASNQLTLGRDASCGVVISDPTVSRHHAKLFVAQGELWCSDLGSVNGTKVNDQSCGRSPMLVTRSGVVTLGKVALQVRFSPTRSRQ